MILLFILGLSLLSLSFYLAQFRYALAEVQPLHPVTEWIPHYFLDSEKIKISVIIPAYNEAANIQNCVTSVLRSTQSSAEQLEVWVVDDQSTDATLAILKTLQQNLADPRLKVISGLPRPTDRVWIGKSWACAQAAEQAIADFLLFLDADVRLKPGTIAAVVQVAQSEQIDLLNCISGLVCGSWSEWLVQPLMFINLLISINSAAAKNPTSPTAFAIGSFLLFRRSAYEQIGGHRAIADQVAEDVALARGIKQAGLKLQHRLGANLADLRMYRCWAELWEGWTKVLYVGSQRNFGLMLFLALVMFSLYVIPWLGLLIGLSKGFAFSWQFLDLVTIALACMAIYLQYRLRSLAQQAFHTPTKYWWLQSLGGILIGVMAIASAIKTETGWGWTWRGRPLSLKSNERT